MINKPETLEEKVEVVATQPEEVKAHEKVVIEEVKKEDKTSSPEKEKGKLDISSEEEPLIVSKEQQKSLAMEDSPNKKSLKGPETSELELK